VTGAEDVREHFDRAMDTAAAAGVPADDIEEMLDDLHDRVEALRAVRGER
jgi:hypothetical protein